MIKYSMHELRNGLKIIIDNEPYLILEHKITKPGKGQAFNKIKIKKFLSGRVIERTIKQGEQIEQANIEEIEMLYLFNDYNDYHFMNNETFEQIQIQEDILNENKYWLIEQEKYTIVFWNQNPIEIIPPNFIELKITDTEPGIKGDTQNSATKSATTSTGYTLKVPLFIEKDSFIKIDTRTKSYVSRIK